MVAIIGTDTADTVIPGFTSIMGQPLATGLADSIEGRGGRALVAILIGRPALTAAEIALI